MKFIDIDNEIKSKYAKNNIFCALVIATIPFLACTMYCLFNSCCISEVFLPNSQWNDELIYYMEMQGIQKHGMPRGYFGYNESHALHGSLSVWSPVLLLCWRVCSLFGVWNLQSPIFCNIIVMSISMFVSALLVKPTMNQMFKMAITYVSLVTITRFTLSGLVESSVYCMLIVYVALIYSLCENRKKTVIFWAYGLGILLTVMRPYYILLLFSPTIVSSKKNAIVSVLCGTIAVGLNFIISYLFCAGYFIPLLNMKWIEVFFTEGIIVGGKEFLYQTYEGIKEFYELIIQRYDTVQGNWAILFAVICIVILFEIICGAFNHDKEKILTFVYAGICFCALFGACVLMFDIPNGSKHMFEFVLIFMFGIALKNQYNKIWGLLICVAVLAFGLSKGEAYTWKLPIAESQDYAIYESKRNEVSEYIYISEELSYDNTVIWPLTDIVNGEKKEFPYQYLYYLPSGVGINICTYDYLKENSDKIKSKYVMTLKSGELSNIYNEYEMAWYDENVVLYILR